MLTFPLILAAVSAGLIGGFHCVGMCGGIAGMLSRLPRLQSSQHKHARKIIPIVSKTPVAPSEFTTGNFVANPVQDSGSLTPASQVNSQTDLMYQCQLHGGRLSTYMLIGAIFGGVGAASLRWKTDLPISTGLFVIGNFALILLGLRLLGVRLQAVFPHIVNDKIQAAYGKLMPAMQKANSHPYLMGIGWGALPCGLSYAIAPFALLSGAAWSGAVLMLVFGLAALPHLLIAQAMSQRLKQQGWIQIVQTLFALILLGLGLMGLFYFDMKNMPDFLCVTPKY